LLISSQNQYWIEVKKTSSRASNGVDVATTGGHDVIGPRHGHRVHAAAPGVTPGGMGIVAISWDFMDFNGVGVFLTG